MTIQHGREDFRAHVLAAIDLVNNSRRSSARANSLLRSVGCVTQSQWRRNPYFPRPSEPCKALVVTALEVGVRVLCSYGPAPCINMEQAVAALYMLDAWRTCLESPHDVHVFAMTLVMLATYTAYSDSQAIEVLNDWLRPETRYVLQSVDDTATLQQTILTDMFGEPWWMFNGPDADEKFDFTRVIVQRPGFRTGLVPNLAFPSGVSLALPALE